MERQRTKNAVVAQMVRDAIVNDGRREDGKTPLGDVLEMAKVWFDRAKTLVGWKRCYYATCVQNGFDKFLCSQESDLGILDFWQGDVVECYDVNGVHRVGVVKYIDIRPIIHGGGHATVVFPDGDEKNYAWDYMLHSKMPQSVIDIAKAQIMASGKCPFSKGE